VKGSTVTENLATLEQLEGSIILWQMRLEHVGLDSLKLWQSNDY